MNLPRFAPLALVGLVFGSAAWGQDAKAPVDAATRRKVSRHTAAVARATDPRSLEKSMIDPPDNFPVDW